MAIRKVRGQDLYEVKFYVRTRKEAKQALDMHAMKGGGPGDAPPAPTPPPANLPPPPAGLSPFAVYQYYISNGRSHNDSVIKYLLALFREFSGMTRVDYESALGELNRRFRLDPLYNEMRQVLEDHFRRVTLTVGRTG